MSEKVITDSSIWISGPTKPFLDDFIKIKELGSGAYGVIYECQRKCDNKCFAVKYLNKKGLYGMEESIKCQYIERLQNEIDILDTLNHDNIIELEGIYEDRNTLYIVTEECEGGELFDRLYQRKRYSEHDAAKVIKQLLSALIYMHEEKGIIHCDLKPGNILFLTKNEDSLLKIIDFGFSKKIKPFKYFKNQCGTPFYTAPEVIKRKYNQSCDMWSVGVILFCMIYGYPPFYVDDQNDEEREKKLIYQQIIKGFQPKIKAVSTNGYGPWFPDNIKTSKEVRDLMSKLLTRNLYNRYTAKEALIHPWFAKQINNKNEIESTIMSQLIKFQNVSQFNLIISKLFREQFKRKRPEHLQQLKQLFFKFDTNNDGIWSYQDFKFAINLTMNGISNIDEIYEQLSTSSVGIKFDHLLDIMVYDYLISCDERLYNAFIRLDNDKDGKITINDLKQKLKRIDYIKNCDESIKCIENAFESMNGVMNSADFVLKLHPYFEETSK